MNIALLIDIDSERENGHQIRIQQVNRTINDEIIPTDNYDIIEQMAVLCEGICTLIHCADQLNIKPSYNSIEDCIKHITDGFLDPTYKGNIINQ